MIDGYFDFQILVYHSQDKPLLRSTVLLSGVRLDYVRLYRVGKL